MARRWKLSVLLLLTIASPGIAQDKQVVGLIPKAQKPVAFDGKLTGWDGAFVTPVHIGHPDFANRGGQFLFLWDGQNLYIGLRCLDQHPAHVGPDNQIWNGDAVEFYLDTRRGDKLGGKEFAAGTLHCFYTPFTKTEVKPRIQVRDLPAFKDFKLQGAEVAAAKTAWGWTAEFKLPWANFPEFKPKAGEIIGIDCELCSSDGGLRSDRTFVYSGPADVGSPSAFGRVQLVDKVEEADLKPFGRALLPTAVTKSANYDWLFASVCISPTISKSVTKLEGKLVGADGKVRKTTVGSRKALEGGFDLWTGSFELFDLPHGEYTLELSALDKDGKVITSRTVKVNRNELVLAKLSDREFTIIIDDVRQFLKQADAPIREGPLKFPCNVRVVEKDGKFLVEAACLYGFNGFELGYYLSGSLKEGILYKKELHAGDFVSISVEYRDDWLESRGLTEKDVSALIEQLRDPANKVRVGIVVIPGGEFLDISAPMRKLIILGEKARGPLQARLADPQIQNEVAVILGAIGDETTVPALIKAYPEGDLRKAESDGRDYLKGVCFTTALTYLTAQPIGRSRYGADLEPKNKKLWNDWWAEAGGTFKVPTKKPNASWVPEYPLLTEEWAVHCREEFAKGDRQK